MLGRSAFPENVILFRAGTLVLLACLVNPYFDEGDAAAAVFIEQRLAEKLNLPTADITPLKHPPGTKLLDASR